MRIPPSAISSRASKIADRRVRSFGRLTGVAFAAWFLLACAGSAGAQQLTIGLALEPNSIDPHFSQVPNNASFARYLFDPLVLQDKTQRLQPGLALSWKAIDDTTWELRLRPGVKFHDGSDFTADDVAFTLARAPAVPNAPPQYVALGRLVTAVDIVDPLTVRIKTQTPYPVLPNDLSMLAILSRRAAAGATTADFNSGKAAIGTGPFRFVEWKPGAAIVIERNDAYWGGRASWQRVILRPISSGPARAAALLARDVDVIESVPLESLREFKSRPDLVVSETAQNRFLYLMIDVYRDQSPQVTDRAGRPLDRNPLKDVRVRRAISKAINREAIVNQVMDGAGQPAAQLLPAGYFGVSANLRPEPFDPEGALRLMAEAGFANGFGLTLHGPNNRAPFDDKLALALAQMFSKVGIETKVETMPFSVALTRRANSEFSLFINTWGSETGEPGGPLRVLAGTFDPPKGWGNINFGRYSSREFDQTLERALTTMDDAQRDLLLQRATEVAMNDVAIIPIVFQSAIWATRRGIAYTPRADGYTLAYEVVPRP